MLDSKNTVSEGAPPDTKELWQRHDAVSSDKYPDPKLNSLSALIEYAAQRYSSGTAFYFPLTKELDTKFDSVSWDQFHRITNTIAVQYAKIIQKLLAEANETKMQPTVALLGHGDTIQYYITQMALHKLNLRVLLLAQNNYASAMRSLLQRCKVSVLFVEEGSEVPFLAKDVLHVDMIMNSLNFRDTPISDEKISRFEDDQDPWERPTFIIHSSGSTGPQKPIAHTNRSILTASRMYRLYPNFHIHCWLLQFPL